MFTGITQAVGKITKLTKRHDKELRLTVTTDKTFFAPALIGASIMIDGVCLTIIDKTEQTADFDVMQPTFDTTIVQNYTLNQPVNLEMAMLATDRFDGHIVSGHVDGMATVTRVRQAGETVWLTFQPNQSDLMAQIVPKGAITVSGVSLTVIETDQTTFTIGLIPHTLAHTNLNTLTVGMHVNIETDVIAKYLAGINHDEYSNTKGA